jgi:hypothetical protein
VSFLVALMRDNHTVCPTIPSKSSLSAMERHQIRSLGRPLKSLRFVSVRSACRRCARR